jgi:hypothetical protein
MIRPTPITRMTERVKRRIVLLAFCVDAVNLAPIGAGAIGVGDDSEYGFSPLHKHEVVK